LKVQTNRHYTFQFNRDGFHENRITKNGAELAAAASYRMDVQLERIGNTTTVNGVVKSENGEPLAGQQVYLQSSSLNARYRAVSDKEGNFTLPGVALGTDYRLWVLPSGMYGQHQRNPVEITENTPLLEISLPVLYGGSVSGQVVDAEGGPMGNFTLHLHSQQFGSSSRAVTDENGCFGPVKLAAGKITFFTQAQPRFSINGFDLQAGNQQNAHLVMDWGSYQVRGTVADGSGTVVAGAKVNMFMAYQFDEMKASSNRNTITDESGFFRFTQVGPGTHRVTVNEDRYKPYNTEHDVGGGGGDELKIELEPKE
ncbi:MAG: carboxypeptidase-like regulatory domain-containing protein, partial [Pseudomonadota bacterium]|nr:carboxypeptidase-like regulatory domain-containing protein [Pseudomonadota bacterium]